MLERTTALAFLMTDTGRALLKEAETLPADRLTRIERLRKRYLPEVATIAVELLELRHRARRKFTAADSMYFTPEGLEQSSGDRIANYRAQRFPRKAWLLDACCGIGGDARAFVQNSPVVAVDMSPSAILCTQANIPEAPFPCYALCSDVTTLAFASWRDMGVTSAFFDPSRRLTDQKGERRRVVRNADDYSPPLSFLNTLREYFPDLGVKVSPAVPDHLLQEFPEARIEFISDRGECKEAVLWFGQPALALSDTPTATVLRSDCAPQSIAATEETQMDCGAPRIYLYEPDPAVIRAHAHRTLAAQLDGSFLSEEIAYFTADRLTETPFATAYRVLDWLPYNEKSAQAWLRQHSARLIAIKKRGVPYLPEEVRKRLKDAGETPVILVLARYTGKPIALFCELLLPISAS